MSYLLPQCSAAGGERGNGCSLWEAQGAAMCRSSSQWCFLQLLDVAVPGTQSLGLQEGQGRVGAISCWRESVLDPGTRLRFVSCHEHLGSWMQEILPLGMWSTGELSCVGTWLTQTPWTVGIIHLPPPNPLQTESLPSPASAPSGAPTNLIILNLVLFSRSSI